MPTVYLKTKDKIEVPIEELADYLYENEDKIQLQKLKSRRGVNKVTKYERCHSSLP